MSLKICKQKNAPSWMIYNKYILHGYRVNFNSIYKCLKSLFIINNELVNVYSHLWGTIAFVIILILTNLNIYPVIYILNMNTDKINSNYFYINWNTVDNKVNLSKFSLNIFLISAILCMLFSTSYHLFMPINKKTSRQLQIKDFSGIFTLIFGSCIPIYYISFYCDIKYFYIHSVLSLIYNIIAFLIFLKDIMHLDKFKFLKGFIFLFLSFLICIPFFQIFRKSTDSIEYYKGYNLIIAMGITYITGLVIYLLRIPEYFISNIFDNFGNSHNIWHFFIILACYFHYCGVSNLYIQRELIGCSI